MYPNTKANHMPEITADQHKIIDAAFRRFTKFGPENTTMAQIAKDLGYSRTFLYYYFPDKESIFKMALIRCANKYFDSLQTELKRKITGLKALENGIRTKIFCAKDFQVIGVYTNVILYRMLMEDPDLLYIFSTEQKLLIELIKKGKKDGSIGKCNPVKTAQQITEGLNGYMSFGLRRLEMTGKRNPQEIDGLFKKQLEYGLLLVSAIRK